MTVALDILRGLIAIPLGFAALAGIWWLIMPHEHGRFATSGFGAMGIYAVIAMIFLANMTITVKDGKARSEFFAQPSESKEGER
jgi:hypothetical protein